MRCRRIFGEAEKAGGIVLRFWEMARSVCNPAIEAFHEIERRDGSCGGVPPVSRLGVAVAFLAVLSSFGKYDLLPVFALAVYPFSLAFFERVPIVSALSRFWFLLLPVFLLGAANPFFDRAIIADIAGVPVSGGWISFAVLAAKGALALCVTWSLLRKTGADGLVKAFEALRLPPRFSMAVLLLHRYLVMIVKETERMKDAYLLRSGRRSRAIQPQSWGPFIGLLLMRSMDRAANVQAAIDLRGGCGGRVCGASAHASGSRLLGTLYFAGWVAYFLAVRFFARFMI